MRFLLVLIIAATCSFGTVKEVRTLPKGQIITWETGDTILLKGMVFVDSSILKIQPGVLIKAQKTKAKYLPDDEIYDIDTITALVVTQKGFIQASGSKDNPIIFTSELDSMNGKQLTYPGVVNDSFFGYWGGVAILGSGRVNNAAGSSQFKPAGEEDPRTVYGGTDDEDSCGYLRYVTIRYAGSEHYTRRDEYRFAALNLMGAGNKTHIEYVETFRSYNDGIRLHGGAVNMRYAASCKSTKDGIQCDEGYRGEMQFVFVNMEQSSTSSAERASFRIGGTSAVTDTPYTQPFIVNSTTHSYDNGIPSVEFDKKGAGKIFHSVFHEQCKFKISESAGVGIPSSWEHVKDSLVDVRGNLFWRVFTIKPSPSWGDLLDGDSTMRYVRYRNEIANPKFVYKAGDTMAAPLDFRPDTSFFWWASWKYKNASADDIINCNIRHDYVVSLENENSGSFIDKKQSYVGAFSPYESGMWINGWTSLDAFYNLTTDAEKIVETGSCPAINFNPSSHAKLSNRLIMIPSKTGMPVLKLSLASKPAGAVTVRMFRLNGSSAYVKTFTTCRTGELTIDGKLPASGLYVLRCTTSGKTIYSGKVLLP